jgi:hypothetical protein
MKHVVCLTLLACSVMCFGQPAVVSVSPLNGSGSTATFTSVYRHSGGINKHYLGYLLILPTPNIVWYTAKGSCLIEYNRISNGVRLVNDQGDNWIGRLQGEPAGTGGMVLTSNWCSVDTRNVHASFSGNDMTVTVPVTFAGTFTGEMGTFLQELDVDGNWTGMTQFGNWTPYPISSPKPGPYISNLTPTWPSTSALAPSKVVIDTGNTSGLNNLLYVNVLVADKIVDPAVRCHILYVAPSKEFWLLNDAGTDWIKTSPRQNSTCAIGSFNPDVLSAGTLNGILELNIPIAWNPSTVFPQKLMVMGNTFDNAGNLTHWLQ